MNALLLFACSLGDQVPGIIMSGFLIAVGIIFLYLAARGRGLHFQSVLPRDRVLWTRIIGTGLLAFGVVIFAFAVYRIIWQVCAPPVMRTS